MSSGIYCILCTANGKRYVGQSVAMKRRLTAHLSRLRRGVHYNAHLQAAFQKYGAESFETSVLEECAEDMLDIRERAWISYYQSTNPEFGYNRELGGHAQKATPETRAKLSELLRQRYADPAARAKMSEAHRGKKITPETRAKLSEAARGRTISVETRAKLSKAQQGKKATPEAKARMAKASLGRKHTPETRAKMSETMHQRCATPEARAKLSKIRLGKKATPETRARI